MGIPNKSKVRIMADPEELARLCNRAGNSWSQRVRHMNGKVYTVVKNCPPDRYQVYDPVCAERGIQDGKIWVPCAGVALVLEPKLVLQVKLEIGDLGDFCLKCSHMSGNEVAVVALDKPATQTVAWLKHILAPITGQEE